MALPFPEAKQVAGVRRYLAEYLIVFLTAAVIFMAIEIRGLYREHAETNKALYENKKALEDFTQWQRFARPIRDDRLLRADPPDTSDMRRQYYKY